MFLSCLGSVYWNKNYIKDKKTGNNIEISKIEE